MFTTSHYRGKESKFPSKILPTIKDKKKAHHFRQIKVNRWKISHVFAKLKNLYELFSSICSVLHFIRAFNVLYD